MKKKEVEEKKSKEGEKNSCLMKRTKDTPIQSIVGSVLLASEKEGLKCSFNEHY